MMRVGSFAEMDTRIMGTPSEQIWPGVSQLPDYKETFPQWTKQDLRNVVPNLDDMGIDLLAVSGGASTLDILPDAFCSGR